MRQLTVQQGEVTGQPEYRLIVTISVGAMSGCDG